MLPWQSLSFVTSATTLAACPRAPLPELAFSGRSNVGKSSLLNRLASRRGLAKVSQKPGKTRLLNFFRLGDRAHLVDLPGYGFARVPDSVRKEWASFVSEYLEEREQLAGIIQLIDSRHEPTALDRKMVAWLLERGLPFLIVLTKADKISRGARQKQAALARRGLGLPKEQELLFFSAENGEGRKDLAVWAEKTLDEWHDSGR